MDINSIQPILLADTILPQTILSTAIAWCGAIAAIVLVVFLVNDIIFFIKGECSIGKVLVKAFSVLVIIGIMFLAGSFDTFGDMFKDVFEKVVTEDNLPNVGQK